MRDKLGTNRRMISDGCFRVLSLQFETQNEVDVLKPILEELEVLRLSCALGALTSVNPKDFAFELLEAKEFDDELARFLRSNVFDDGGERGGPQVRVVALFGKQAQMKNQLKRLGGWDDAMEAALSPRDLGLYAVVLPSAVNAEDPAKTVVVFAWLTDEYFRPVRLRATPTYLLRLLTCLTNDVMFCLSEDDKRLLEQFKQSEEDSCEQREWKSYSIAFHVQQQRDAADDVRSSIAQVLSLPSTNKSPRKMKLIKGTYPALIAVTEAPPRKTRSNEARQFQGHDQFCEWIADHLKHFDLRPSSLRCNSASEEVMVRNFGVWPEEELRRCDEALVCKLAGVDEESRQDVMQRCNEYRAKLQSTRDVVFRIEAMWNPADIAASVDQIRTCLQDLKSAMFPEQSTVKLYSVAAAPSSPSSEALLQTAP